MSSNVTSIQCIDLEKIANKRCADDEDDKKEWLRVGKELTTSFEDIGFAYIKNHGIPRDLIDEAKDVGAKFFDLSDDVKLKYEKPIKERQGFVSMSRERFHTSAELRESYDVTNLNGMFPSEVVNFKDSIVDLIEYSKRLSFKLLRCLELGLGLAKGTLLTKHMSPFSPISGSLFRIIYYPPIVGETSEGAVRCGTHSDYGTITLLFQDDIGGLEVLNRDGVWMRADPIPDTILINVGDMLEIWTSGRLISTKHRVPVPDDSFRRNRERRSMTMFVHPDDDILLRPLEGSYTESPITAEQHLWNRYKNTYEF